MSDAAPAAAPAKVTKKRAGGAAKAKKPSDHPKYSDMIKAAITALKVRNSQVLLSLFSSRSIGVGDGGRGHFPPPPKKKKWEYIFRAKSC